MMIAYINVLGTWVETWKSGYFQCARAVFKYLTIYAGLSIHDVNLCSLISLMSSIRVMTLQRAVDMAIYSASVINVRLVTVTWMLR